VKIHRQVTYAEMPPTHAELQIQSQENIMRPAALHSPAKDGGTKHIAKETKESRSS